MLRGPSSSQRLLNSGAQAARRHQEGIARTLQERERLRRALEKRITYTQPKIRHIDTTPSPPTSSYSLYDEDYDYDEELETRSYWQRFKDYIFEGYEGSDWDISVRKRGVLRTIGLAALCEMGLIDEPDD